MSEVVAVHVRSETEVPRGWRYVVDIDRPEGGTTTHRVRLGWVDHNHWTGERPFTPSHVVRTLLECLMEADPGLDLPERFDAATARRWLPALDEALAARL